jgi:hypothetical protein
MMSVFSPSLTFDPENLLYKTWYERFATGGHLNIMVYNFISY